MSESASPAVFLSYASQDAEAARRIAEALRNAGVEVWLDQTEREAVDGALAGQVVRVLNPASMLREKVSLAVEANQTGRQDAKHVEILAPCCR